MDLKVSKQVHAKLKNKHQVSLDEVVEAIVNYSGVIFEDSRAQHKTKPPTILYISETDDGRPLKLVFVATNPLTLKSAYQPSQAAIERFIQSAQAAQGTQL